MSILVGASGEHFEPGDLLKRDGGVEQQELFSRNCRNEQTSGVRQQRNPGESQPQMLWSDMALRSTVLGQVVNHPSVAAERVWSMNLIRSVEMLVPESFSLSFRSRPHQSLLEIVYGSEGEPSERE